MVLAGSGHLPASIDSEVSRAVVPCVSYIMVTEPLGDKLKTAVDAPYGAFDDRFALNYFRPLPDGRLLWGGNHHILHSPFFADTLQGFFQTYPISDAKLKDVMLKDMLRVFPQLKGVKADFVRTPFSGCSCSVCFVYLGLLLRLCNFGVSTLLSGALC